MVQRTWSRKIKAGLKTVEIRASRASIGAAYIMESGSFFITCYIYIGACEGPLSEERWEELRQHHLVPGGRLYGESTYAWFLIGIQPITGVPCGHTTQVTWVTYRGT
jgi:hypothetical protein